MRTTIRTGDAEDFFKRGKDIARLADQGKSIPNERIISFEDSEDLAKLITKAKLSLVKEVKIRPGSIADLSLRLNRDRSSVSRDIHALQKYGLLLIEEKPLPGHGRMKEVRVTDENLLLALI